MWCDCAFLCKRLLETTNDEIIGLDNLNDYYDVSLKEARLEMLKPFDKFTFIKGDISDKVLIDKLFGEYKFDIVVNLAAQAGGLDSPSFLFRVVLLLLQIHQENE